MPQRTSLIELNGLKKVRVGRQVLLDYEIEAKKGAELSIEIEEYVINGGGFRLYEFTATVEFDGQAEYGIGCSTCNGSDIYEELIQFWYFLRLMEGWPITTWEMVRTDVAEFFSAVNPKFELN